MYIVPRLQDSIPVSAGWHACFIALSESFTGIQFDIFLFILRGAVGWCQIWKVTVGCDVITCWKVPGKLLPFTWNKIIQVSLCWISDQLIKSLKILWAEDNWCVAFIAKSKYKCGSFWALFVLVCSVCLTLDYVERSHRRNNLLWLVIMWSLGFWQCLSVHR